MADENLELQRQIEELRRAFQGLEETTDKTSAGMAAAGKAAKGIGSFAKSVGEGDTSFKSLNKIVDTATDVMAGFAKGIPFVEGAIKAVGEASKFMLNQLDQVTAAYNDIGKAGALAADGMTGIQRQFLASGLQLKSFQKQISENSVALARFRGLTSEGAEDFAAITGQLTQGTDDSLRRLGMNADQIGETTGEFIKRQTRLGLSQNKSVTELALGSKQYAMELDLLSKVTGQSRESIQKQQDAALSESRFRANYDELVAQGREKEAKALMDLQIRMSSFGAELGQGTRDLASGAANTDAARKLMASTGGAAQDIISRLKSGAIDQDQAQKELQAATRRTATAQRDNAKYVDAATSAYSAYGQVSDFNTANLEESGMKAKKAQDQQINNTDELTKNTTEAQKKLEKMNIEIQRLGFTFLPHAAVVVNEFSSVMVKVTENLAETLGIELPQAKKRREELNKADAAAWEKMTLMEKAQSSLARGVEKVGGVIPGMGAVTEQAKETRVKNEAKYLKGQGRAPAAPASNPMSQDDLTKSGLKIKQGDVQATGAEINPKLIELAKQIQGGIPGFSYFSGFNDKYHQDSGSSKHPKGLALDFALASSPSAEEGKKIADMIKGMGASYVQDEYNNPSAKSTAGHFHAEISAANGFSGMISGPSSGYRPNITMHGTEAISIQPNPNTGSSSPNSDSSIMSQQLAKLEELVSVMKTQVSISSKLLSYSS